MDQYLLENLAQELKIAPLNIVRENAELAFLQKLSQSDILKRLIFYGGTALRLAYNSPRFSEDLDFLMTQKISAKELASLISDLEKEAGFSLKDLKDKRNTLFALLNVVEPVLKHPLNIKIEISKKKNGLKTEFLPLVSPCSPYKPIIQTATIESLKNLKIQAVKGRQDPKDWFDLWYINKYLKEKYLAPLKFPFDKKEFERQLKRFLPRDKWSLISQIYD